MSELTAEQLNATTEAIIGAAIDVHRELGPGLLESTYEACLAYELAQRGRRFERQKPLPVTYKGVRLDCGYRIDLLVEDAVVVELKAVDRLLDIHTAQVISYLKLADKRLGLLINFNVRILTHGVRRIANRFPPSSPPPSAISASSAVKSCPS